MDTLCRIINVNDEKEFFDRLKKDGCSRHCNGGGWGMFKGQIPAIHSTIAIEFEPGRTEYFRVLYTESWLRPKAYGRVPHPEERRTFLEEGNLSISSCNVYVVKT